MQKDCSKGQLLGRKHDGHRIRYEGGNETNDGAHQRRPEQTRQTGTLLCPILQNGEWVQLPKMNLSLLWPPLKQFGPGAEERGDRRQAGASIERGTCLSSGAKHKLWYR